MASINIIACCLYHCMLLIPGTQVMRNSRLATLLVSACRRVLPVREVDLLLHVHTHRYLALEGGGGGAVPAVSPDMSGSQTGVTSRRLAICVNAAVSH